MDMHVIKSPHCWDGRNVVKREGGQAQTQLQTRVARQVGVLSALPCTILEHGRDLGKVWRFWALLKCSFG